MSLTRNVCHADSETPSLITKMPLPVTKETSIITDSLRRDAVPSLLCTGLSHTLEHQPMQRTDNKWSYAVYFRLKINMKIMKQAGT